MAGLGFGGDDELDEEMCDEEKELLEEAENLREQLDDARKEMQDTDFFTLTENIPEIGRIKLKARKHFRGHLAKLTDLHWSEDSQHLLTASQDGKLIVWDTYTSNKVHLIPLSCHWVIGCCMSPSSNYLASGGLDNIVSLFDLTGRSSPTKPHAELNGHDGYIAGCRYLDDQRLLTCSGDRTCALWSIENGSITERFHGHSNDINALEIMQQPSLNQFISVSSDKTCRLWDIRQVTCTQIFQGHDEDVNGISFFPNNEYAFATSSDDGSVRLWDVRADQPIAIYVDEYIRCGCTSVAISRSGRILIAGYDDYNCHVWDLLREERVGIMPAHDDRVSCVGVSKDGVAIATGSWDNTCILWTTK